ncbi:AAA family ATPase [Magnetococcales bacterium HHB-1]
MMKLTRIILEDFRGFSYLEIPIGDASHVLFIGNNDAGKSTILEAVATGLSWLVGRINLAQGVTGVLLMTP